MTIVQEVAFSAWCSAVMFFIVSWTHVGRGHLPIWVAGSVFVVYWLCRVIEHLLAAESGRLGGSTERPPRRRW
jgi:hypothetical protein